jgi:hypothetical protein
MMTTAASAMLACSAAAGAAVLRVDGTFTSYANVLGAADPYAIVVPETYTLVLNTSGNSVVNGTMTFTGSSSSQFTVTGGTLAVGAATDFAGIALPTTGGGVGGTISLSFNTAIPDTTQAGLDTLIGKTGPCSLGGFPFTNRSNGFYQGTMTAVAIPEPATIATLALPMLTLMRRRTH